MVSREVLQKRRFDVDWIQTIKQTHRKDFIRFVYN